MLGVVVPVDLQADGVADHPVKTGDASAGGVEKFPPEELPVQGDRGLGVLPLLAKAGSAPLAGLAAVFSSPPTPSAGSLWLSLCPAPQKWCLTPW